ncbi:16S rRNA (uracil(1498)-N(3))-methyltransferase [Paenibacillus sp. YN15]|uniref:16S rRNA (uracil(1498)-N(3))-methyltransferase n=1 Tax=Paenibacillus sp. YN15 TaxID=1742774 RepID=UPI000DCEEA23|nr:16S rRNA (uracil(1498)-N(3))-methyltransferase [Paenibacillus sp. YN15]RAU94202.1 16S rRNA (uracil(1498)-N(3))-methyltransferase [Paenibacillus sp. YN15]
MQRYFVPPEQLAGGLARLIGEDAHHLAKVMRAEPGEEIIVTNGLDREVLVRVSVIDKGLVEAQVVRELPMDREAAVEVWIAQSLPKGDKLETVIQKCTELGADRFIPFLSKRTVVQYDEKKEAKRLERWAKIAKEAAEQAHRNRIPAIDGPVGWKRLLELAKETDLALFCYELESGFALRELLAKQLAVPSADGRRPRILVMVGPEGGFTEQEAAEAEAAGCRSISLGKRILRTETAAMAALTCIMYESGEMGVKG